MVIKRTNLSQLELSILPGRVGFRSLSGFYLRSFDHRSEFRFWKPKLTSENWRHFFFPLSTSSSSPHEGGSLIRLHLTGRIVDLYKSVLDRVWSRPSVSRSRRRERPRRRRRTQQLGVTHSALVVTRHSAGADTHVVYGSHTVTVTLQTVNQSKKKSSVDVDTIKRQIEGWGLKKPDKT